MYNLALALDQSSCGDLAGLNRNFMLRNFPGTDLYLCMGDDTETCYSIAFLIRDIRFLNYRLCVLFSHPCLFLSTVLKGSARGRDLSGF